MTMSTALSNSSSRSVSPSAPPPPDLICTSWGSKLCLLMVLRNLTLLRTSWSSMRQPWARMSSLERGERNSMSPWPRSSSPPFWSMTMRESMPELTFMQMRQGMLDLMSPVTTLA